MKRTVLFLLTVLITHFVIAQKTTFEWPDHPSSQVMMDLIDAYNTEDIEQMENFSSNCYPAEKVEEKVRFWAKVYSEYGVLEPFKVAEEELSPGTPGIWFQGRDSKNWVQLILIMNEQGDQILANSVVRGIRPVGHLPPYTSLLPEEFEGHLNAYLDQLAEKDMFSGAVLVAKGEEVLFKKAYGMRDQENHKENNLQTSFGIASTTKTFTALAIAQLVEQGKLNYDDPISKFLPNYPRDIADQVTVHHLLTHTSGLEFDDYEPFMAATMKAKTT